MHLLLRETRTLDDAEAAVDLAQSPGDVVFLSFSDSDLGAAASAWQASDGRLPSLRLANLAKLRHPLSVDLYLEQVITRARCPLQPILPGLALILACRLSRFPVTACTRLVLPISQGGRLR